MRKLDSQEVSTEPESLSQSNTRRYSTVSCTIVNKTPRTIRPRTSKVSLPSIRAHRKSPLSCSTWSWPPLCRLCVSPNCTVFCPVTPRVLSHLHRFPPKLQTTSVCVTMCACESCVCLYMHSLSLNTKKFCSPVPSASPINARPGRTKTAH